MALYTDVIDEEMRMAEALKSSNALSAQGGKEKKASSKTKKTSKASAGKKAPAEGEPMMVGVQRTGSGDSDFGLLLYSDEEEERGETILICVQILNGFAWAEKSRSGVVIWPLLLHFGTQLPSHGRSLASTTVTVTVALTATATTSPRRSRRRRKSDFSCSAR
jgi:hypothetical protein